MQFRSAKPNSKWNFCNKIEEYDPRIDKWAIVKEIDPEKMR